MRIFLMTRRTTMHTKQIWRQEDREDSMAAARRTVIKATTTLAGFWALYEADLEGVRYKTPIYDRALKPLTDALNAARTLLEAYDYFLARCAEAGLTAVQAHAAWEAQSSPAWEAELVDAESYGPNALRLVDEHILSHLGIVPHEEMTEQDDGSIDEDEA